MLNLEDEKAHLAKADRDIAEGEARIARQLETVEVLRNKKHGVAEAEALLEALRQSLQTWRTHRELIAQTVARLEHARAGPSRRP